ncbi:Alginate biosynthesis protein AlgA [compost metagenome]
MEPFGRNTAPAVAMAAMKLVNEGRDELMLVLPADHVIDDQKALQRALALATVAAHGMGKHDRADERSLHRRMPVRRLGKR